MMARSVYAFLLPLTVSTLLGACGDDQSAEEGSSDTTVAEPSTGGDPSASSTGEPLPTTGDDAGSTTGDDTTDGNSGSGSVSDSDGTTGEPSPYDGEPLPPADDGVWTWVDFPEAKCRDGSSTGIGVRYGSGSGVAIYFEGGGACFNALTCGANPANFGAGQFAAFSAGANSGIYDSDDPDNPLADWSIVYVPYCTGDVHAGARANGTLPDFPGPQQFVGYLNVGHFLQRVVPTFLGEVDHVLVTGVSAGGFGAAFNYDRIADAFPNDRVTLLDDSGPPMSDDYMAPCLQKKWREAWNLDETMPADCANCFPEDGGGIVNLGAYIGEKHSDQRLALVSSLGDQTIRFFFGFGNDECNALFPSTSEDKFAEGLVDLRDNWMNEPAGVWGTFFLSGTQHTWIGGGSFDNAESGGVKLNDWVRELLAGNVSNVEP
jgi:hypothetical protein